MKLGLIARSDNSGLGNQTLGFYKHLKPHRTLVVDISRLNSNKTYPDRYGKDGVEHIDGFPSDLQLHNFVQDLDVVLIAESAYSRNFYNIAKQHSVKVAVQYNYEFFDWFDAPDKDLPDMFIAPSKWHYNDVDKFCKDKDIKHLYLHYPVDRNDLPPRYIEKAQTFLHPAGKSAAHDRNGTYNVIDASKHVKSNVDIVIHFQGEQGLAHQMTATTQDYIEYAEKNGNMDKLIISVQEYENYQDVYAEGDVLILPRRYGGNCMPVNEALSVGMPVIMPNMIPNNELLPIEWLVPTATIDQFTPRTVVDINTVDPVLLAKKIDEFANMTTDDVIDNNSLANTIADSISWETMLPMYQTALEDLCRS